jgi:hypothetical protein
MLAGVARPVAAMPGSRPMRLKQRQLLIGGFRDEDRESPGAQALRRIDLEREIESSTTKTAGAAIQLGEGPRESTRAAKHDPSGQV